MQLIAEKRSKTDKYDVLRCIRNNGSSTDTLMPRQGILPHDLIHFVVESALPLQFGFLSLVARGADAQMVMDEVHDQNNPAVDIHAAQAEAIVEGLQSQLWSGSFDYDAFVEGAASACAGRAKPPFDFSQVADVKASLYDRAVSLTEQWMATPFYGTLSLEFRPKSL